MQAILKLIYKLLVNDKVKLSGLLVGIASAVLLMIEMTPLFAGILNRFSSAMYNIGARMRVMDPAVNTVANSIGIPDYILDAVCSAHSVRFTVLLYSGGVFVHPSSGFYQPMTVADINDTGLFGRLRMSSGCIQDLYGENAFIVIQDIELGKLENPHIGTEPEVNDHQGATVGIGEVVSSGLFGTPTPYTVYRRVIRHLLSTRYTMSHTLIESKAGAGIAAIERAAGWLGYRVLTGEEFVGHISYFYTHQTGLGTSILLMTTISLVMGLSIFGQMLYIFIPESLERFGALKAIGTKGRELVTIIVFQVTFVALVGHGLGIGLHAAPIALARLRIPDYIAMIIFANLMLALVMVTVIAGISDYIGVRKALHTEPFDISQG